MRARNQSKHNEIVIRIYYFWSRAARTIFWGHNRLEEGGEEGEGEDGDEEDDEEEVEKEGRRVLENGSKKEIAPPIVGGIS